MSGFLNSMSSHICDSWYFPVFLMRDGSLILMYIASVMVLSRLILCSKWCNYPNWFDDLWFWHGHGWVEGALGCSLSLFSKVLADSPLYCPLHSTLSHFYVDYATFLWHGVHVKEVFDGVGPLNYTLFPILLLIFLKLPLNELMTHLSIETLGSTSCHIYGMMPWLTPQTSSLSNL